MATELSEAINRHLEVRQAVHNLSQQIAEERKLKDAEDWAAIQVASAIESRD